ncbi:MAG TPA: DNA-processing protein DprA [Candidatus Microsaccharimonas sp.]|nr:DNA-processing protein DprA [Candidatus Microsaccharimonas sp.]
MDIYELPHNQLPERLRQLSSPPGQLFHAGADLDDLLKRPTVAIVGSRKVTPYGQQITTKLARELAEQGIVIVSGLALGVDALAHEAALAVGGLTIAVLPSSLEHIAPRSHVGLAQRIVQGGGTLVSEYPHGSETFRTNFVARNRLVAGLADAVLITEAALKSGSLHTARFALEQGKDVLAVPGNITSPTSEGANNLLRAGAVPVTCAEDVLSVLQLKFHAITPLKIAQGANIYEQAIIDLLKDGLTDGDQLQRSSQLDIAQFNQTLTMLELSGKIRPLGAGHWALT